jgi:hypothetical protein
MMAFYPLFANQAFEPETLESMSDAYETVCKALRLNVKRDLVTETVAECIVEFAQRGVRDTPSLTAMTLQEFNVRI